MKKQRIVSSPKKASESETKNEPAFVDGLINFGGYDGLESKLQVGYQSFHDDTK